MEQEDSKGFVLNNTENNEFEARAKEYFANASAVLVEQQEHQPMVVGIGSKGIYVIPIDIESKYTKEMCADLVRWVVETHNVQDVFFTSEAWVSSGHKKAPDRMPSEYPNRIEKLMVRAENREGGVCHILGEFVRENGKIIGTRNIQVMQKESGFDQINEGPLSNFFGKPFEANDEMRNYIVDMQRNNKRYRKSYNGKRITLH